MDRNNTNNNSAKLKLRYFETILSDSNMFDIGKTSVNNNNTSTGAAEAKSNSKEKENESEEAEKDRFNKSIDIGKDLTKQARGLCFDFMVQSPQKLKQYVEDCQV